MLNEEKILSQENFNQAGDQENRQENLAQTAEKMINNMQTESIGLEQEGAGRLASVESAGGSVEEAEREIGPQLLSIQERGAVLFDKTKNMINEKVADGKEMEADSKEVLKNKGKNKNEALELRESLQQLRSTRNNVEAMINSKNYSSEKEKKALEEFLHSIKENEKVVFLALTEIDPVYNMTKIKSDLIAQISSQEYLRKLTLEFNGDVKNAQKLQQERIGNIKTLEVNFVDAKDMNEAFVRPDWLPAGVKTPEWLTEIILQMKGLSPGIAGFYKSKENKAVLPDVINSKTNFHETVHAGTVEMSPKAIKIFMEAYQESHTSADKYFKEPWEMYVRMKSLEKDMEKFEIKKYNERFTDEHIQKIFELYRNGKLSKNSQEFLDRIKPEYLKMIFDTIAMDTPANSDAEAFAIDEPEKPDDKVA
jgi:hypothetical protein